MGGVAEIDAAHLREMLDKHALAELCAAYSRAVDRLDEAALIDLFHPDAEIDSGVLRGDPRYFAREFVIWVRTRTKLVYHAACQHWFEVEGDRARGESYLIAAARLVESDGERDTVTFGRYLDRFERRDGRWRFSERRFVLDHSIARRHTEPAHAGPDPPLEGRGCFGKGDPVYRLWDAPL